MQEEAWLGFCREIGFQSALPTELCGQNRMGVLYRWALLVSNFI